MPKTVRNETKELNLNSKEIVKHGWLNLSELLDEEKTGRSRGEGGLTAATAKRPCSQSESKQDRSSEPNDMRPLLQ